VEGTRFHDETFLKICLSDKDILFLFQLLQVMWRCLWSSSSFSYCPACLLSLVL